MFRGSGTDAGGGPRFFVARLRAGLQRPLGLAAVVLAGLACLGLGFVAIALPYHSWDALALGEWSRLIAQTGDFFFPTTTPLMYQRPLFYVAQGWLWRLVGFTEAGGRALAFLFGVLFFVAVLGLAKRLAPSPRSVPLAFLLMLAVPGVLEEFCSGLTDMPVAALVAACAALGWTDRRSWFRSLALAVTAALAVLAKPSALPALAGLSLALAVGDRRTVWKRLAFASLPIAIGIAGALAYCAAVARRIGLTVMGLLAGELGDYYEALAAEQRIAALLRFDWLGPGLRILLAFALLYGVLRVFGLAHRRAGAASVAGAALLCFLLPALLGHGSYWKILGLTGRSGVLLAVSWALLLLALTLVGAKSAEGPRRLDVARLLIWAIPGLLSWLAFAAYDVRLLSAIWAPLLLLVLLAVIPVLDAAEGKSVLAFAAAAGLFLAAAVNLPRIDRLGLGGWRRVLASVADGRIDQGSMRLALFGEFEMTRSLLAREMKPEDRLFTNDGRFRFFFPGRVAQGYPHGCESLRGYSFFVFVLSPSSVDYMIRFLRVPVDQAYWESCRDPWLTPMPGTENQLIFRIREEEPAKGEGENSPR